MTAHRYGLLLFFLFLVPIASAQQAILRGFVTDAASEQPLQGATIALKQEGRLVQGTATDGDGYFVLNRVLPGGYDLEISFIGYASHGESLTLRAGEIRDIRIDLAIRAADLEEVVVVAEAEGGITTVAAGLETVVPAAIKRVPVPGVSGDLASYLQTTPGVTVQGDRGGQFFVRGGAVDQNLALLDGIPVYQPFHILSFYSAFPEEL
ncbi:MAG: TonB-dependent receptor, partial [Bacteroidetes bacterium]|nr:TonB-dependent receptor [Bacteroidota bacterium]